MASRHAVACIALLVAVIFPSRVCGGQCGLAPEAPGLITDAEQLVSSTSSRQCIADWESRHSPLQSLFRDVAIQYSGAGLKMLIKDWATHAINSAIVYILIKEVLQHEPPILCTTESKYTSGSFDLLSTLPVTPPRAAEVDLDLELWSTSSYDEYMAAKGRYLKAGSTYSFARSGLFLRPAPGVEAALLRHGRYYRNLVREVFDSLPTLEYVRAMTDSWCNQVPVGDSCAEYPNLRCYEQPDECRVLLKDYDTTDGDTVEEMIFNASLPLMIAYVGGWHFLNNALYANQTFLFYTWEPSLVVGPGSGLMRVDFENPRLCEVGQSFVLLPQDSACDFPAGDVHKGYSKRVPQTFPEVAYLIDQYELQTSTVLKLEADYIERRKEDEHALFEVACDWINENPDVWAKWLLKLDPIEPYYKNGGPIIFVSLAWALGLIWVCLPCTSARPESGSHWYDYALWMRPIRMFSRMLAIAVWVKRRFAAMLASCRRPKESQSTSLPVRLPRPHPGKSQINHPSISIDNGERVQAVTSDKARTSTSHWSSEILQSPTSHGHHSVSFERSSTRQAMNQDDYDFLLQLREESLEFATRQYTSRQIIAAVMIQTYLRTGSRFEASRARSKALERARCGIQFAQPVVWCVEDNQDFRVGVIRGQAQRSRSFSVRVNAVEISAHEGIDYVLTDEIVTFQPGDRFATIKLQTLDNGVSMESSASHSWSPVRELMLQLRVIDPADSQQLGHASECHVNIVDKDRWPSDPTSANWSANSVYWAYVRLVFAYNFTDEAWWIVGVVTRGLLQRIVKNVLAMLLLDLAILGQSLDWAFTLAAAYLLCEVIDHITTYWRNSSWMIGYNVSLKWVLAKWSQLPLSSADSFPTKYRFFGLIDLITSAFFGENDYSVFADIVEVAINIVLLLLAPIIVFNLDSCSIELENGKCLKPELFFNPTYQTVGVTAFVTGLNLVVLAIYFSLDRVIESRYEQDVREWLKKEHHFTQQLHDFIHDSVLHRMFNKGSEELLDVIKAMENARQKNSVVLSAMDQGGRGYTWLLTALYIGALMCTPFLHGIFQLSVGSIMAILSIMLQGNNAITQFSSVNERLRIARYLVNELASILNEGREHLFERVESSRLQVSAIKRAMHDLDMEFVAIVFYRAVYESQSMKDEFGANVAFSLEGQLPTGELIGLTCAHEDDATLEMNRSRQEMVHRIIIDLIGGTRFVKEGATIIGPHLTVGVVPTQPHFLSSKTLYENLTYGCKGGKPPEGVIWYLCRAVGLPPHLFTPAYGRMSIDQILMALTPSDLQLLSVVRTLVSQPDVLVIHNLGDLRPGAAKRLGQILEMYVEGSTLTRLGGSTKFRKGMVNEQQSAKSSEPQDRGSFSLDESSADKRRPPSLKRSVTSVLSNAALQTLSIQRRQVKLVVESPDEAVQRGAHRRTVIWNASVSTLSEAGVQHIVMYKNQRLVRYVHPLHKLPSVDPTFAPAFPSTPKTPTQTPKTPRATPSDANEAALEANGGRTEAPAVPRAAETADVNEQADPVRGQREIPSGSELAQPRAPAGTSTARKKKDAQLSWLESHMDLSGDMSSDTKEEPRLRV